MTLSDAYLMMWENSKFANNPEISFILKEKLARHKTLDLWRGCYQTLKCLKIAAIHPISMGSKYDRAVIHFCRNQKKYVTLATGGATIWAQQAQDTLKIKKSQGFLVFGQYFVVPCKMYSSKHVESFLGVLTHVILRSQVIWTNRTHFGTFWNKLIFYKNQLFSFL